MDNENMSIGSFSRRSLLSIKALRLYDELGLLRPDHVDSESGYRYYRQAQLHQARRISLLRRLEVPLVTIRELQNLEDIEASTALQQWWNTEEEKFNQRKDLLAYMRGTVLEDQRAALSNHQTYAIEVREVPEATYLYHTGRVLGPDLPRFIDESLEQLTMRAAHFGAVGREYAVMFGGFADYDSDGPVDVCIPVSVGTDAASGDLVRTESAHTQAFVRLLPHQVAFPQILQVYQAIRTWMSEHGYTRSGMPREIYPLGEHGGGPIGVTCEVAIPISAEKGTRK